MDLYELENKLKHLRILGAEDHTPVIVVVDKALEDVEVWSEIEDVSIDHTLARKKIEIHV